MENACQVHLNLTCPYWTLMFQCGTVWVNPSGGIFFFSYTLSVLCIKPFIRLFSFLVLWILPIMARLLSGSEGVSCAPLTAAHIDDHSQQRGPTNICKRKSKIAWRRIGAIAFSLAGLLETFDCIARLEWSLEISLQCHRVNVAKLPTDTVDHVFPNQCTFFMRLHAWYWIVIYQGPHQEQALSRVARILLCCCSELLCLQYCFDCVSFLPACIFFVFFWSGLDMSNACCTSCFNLCSIPPLHCTVCKYQQHLPESGG